MKFQQAFWLAVVALVSVVARPASAEAALRVVASFPQDAAIVKALGGDQVRVTSLTRASKDPHSLQPWPSLSLQLNKADLLVTNGQDMELAWLPIALANARNPRILPGEEEHFDPSEGVDLIPYSKDELRDTPFYGLNLVAGAEKAGGGQVSLKRGNHHYWLDPANGLIVAKNIADKLVEMDPDHSALYRTNLGKFTATLTAKMAQWDKAMAPFAGTRVVTYHRDWIYLINRHKLTLTGYVEPRETVPPSAGEMAALVKKMKLTKTRLVLTSPWQNLRIPAEVAKQADGTHLVLPSTVGEDVGVKDYIDLFEVVYGKLVPALKAVQE